MKNYDFLTDDEFKAVDQYAKSVENLKNIELISKHSIVGSLGEHFVEKYYNKCCPELGFELKADKDIDGIDKNGRTYQIKTVTGKIAGSFRQLENINYVVVVVLSRETYLPERMYICDMKKFKEKIFKNRKYFKLEKISISQKLLVENFKKIFDIDEK